MITDPSMFVSASRPTATVGPKSTDREVAEQFETIIIQTMLKSMRSEEGGLFGSGETAMFADYFDQAIADAVKAGGGLGYADQMERTANGKVVPPTGHHSFLPRHIEGGEDPIFPVEGGRLTSNFGTRIDPFHGRLKEHHGLDIAAPSGTPIRATLDGTVTYAGDRGGYGNLVILRHADGTETRYGHCSSLKVREGDRIQAGQTVATVGSTGRSTGPHLHFEVRKEGKILDPAEWLGSGQKKSQQHTEVIRGGS